MKLAIIGTVGVPGRYGGFETLAENLVKYSEQRPGFSDSLTVYCSAKAYPEREAVYRGAHLRYSRLSANGPQSIVYDVVTAVDAAIRGHDRLLMLGVSGAIIIPILRRLFKSKIVINVDGIEWRRDKWKGFARKFLKFSEAIAVRHSNAVVADNQGIADYLKQEYGVTVEVIAYGGDHALLTGFDEAPSIPNIPEKYALALCRIEPENNVEMILEAFDATTQPLVFVGNWNGSDYGRRVRESFSNQPGLYLLDPVYEPALLFSIRRGAASYVHGHSAGGTNPSLVEMMHFGIPIFAHGNDFNRYTTEDKACYFISAKQLTTTFSELTEDEATKVGHEMKKVARRRYTWDQIGEDYFELLRNLKD